MKKDVTLISKFQVSKATKQVYSPKNENFWRHRWVARHHRCLLAYLIDSRSSVRHDVYRVWAIGGACRLLFGIGCRLRIVAINTWRMADVKNQVTDIKASRTRWRTAHLPRLEIGLGSTIGCDDDVYKRHYGGKLGSPDVGCWPYWPLASGHTDRRRRQRIGGTLSCWSEAPSIRFNPRDHQSRHTHTHRQTERQTCRRGAVTLLQPGWQ